MAAMLEGKSIPCKKSKNKRKSIPSNMAASRKSYFFVEKSKCHKIFPLNTFPLKFQVLDNFYVLWLFLASARFQGIV